MSHEDVQRWLDSYVEAWRTYDAEAIGALFTDEAVYAYTPVGEPVRGRDAIVAGWLSDRDEPGSWQASYRPLIVEDDRAVAVGQTTYANGRTFENLYVLRFAEDGRCAELTEWYWQHPAAESDS
jgi:ketosteroid isomerase-like protein